MPQEIERKFVVANDGWRRGADQGKRLRQAYLAETERAIVRVRIEDDVRGFLTIKSSESALSRQEFEFPLKLVDAEPLLDLRQGTVLQKTRFQVPHAERTWEVDVYSGDNAGLVIAEIELAHEQEAVEVPPWLGWEVTGLPEYYAARLARHPYGSWTEAERRRSG